MEAVPKLPLISFELKSSPENPHFGSKLKQYISEAYREDPDSYNNEIHQLEGLRSSAVRPSIDATGLSTMYRYFCQLKALQSRFPMSKGQPVACTFGWRDLYSNSTTYVADLRFEMGCILYNIGALHTQLASSEPRNTADSLKASCTHYQNAAWAFQCLREQYPQQGGVDVSVEIVRLMQEICFAQAQECILDKSIQDTRKPSVVGAVASQVQLFYKNSLALLGSSTGTDNIHEVIGTKIYNYWHRYLSFKLSYIGCIVCLYQGMHSEEQRKMGERVAFYQLAVDKLGEARKLAKYIEPKRITEEALTFTNDVVEGKRKAAKNENEFIYHEEVPEKDMLVDFKPVCLVKALALNLNDPEVSGPDIFARLVPIGAHEASSLYSEEKAKLLRNIVGQAEAKNMELTEFMSSLQLDQLEVLDAEERIPQEIVDRCAAMNAKTEIIQTLVDSMNNLAEIISDVEQSLADIKVLIQEETLKEKEYQKTMGPRPPSIVQTELSREYHKYQEAHARTNESNQVLHKAMTLHIANLRLLAQPLDVLQAKIPSIDNIEGLDRETMAEMRRVVSKVREMQAQRDSLIQQLRESVTADDITSKLLARSEDNADEIFKEEIEKHTPKVKIIEQNLAAQENIINRLTSLYAAYGDSRRMLADVLRKREGLINALITSYDTHEELLGKSHKGLEFYNKLSHNVRNLLTRARATCQVQAEERATLLAAQAARAATPTSSSTPSPALPAGLPPPAAGMKLKDYLPYMKNRGRAAPIAPVEPVPADGYYPESIYPTSVRPAPVGSEANDATQMAIPDGVVLPTSSHNPSMPFNRFASPFVSNDSESYASYYEGQKTNYAKPVEDNPYAYNTPFTPSQFPNQMSDHQIYQNPYYSGTQSNITQVTESPNPYNSNPYAHEPQIPPANQINTIPEAMPYPTNQVDLNSSFAQLQVGGPKTENPYAQDYSQTYYNVQYPNASTPNTSTYSHAGQHNQNGQNMNMTSSQNMAEYSSLNYPYSTESTVPVSNTFNAADPQYSYPNTYNTNQGYPIYTNTETTGAMTSSISSTATSVDPFSADPHYIDPAIRAQLEAIDKPIKSHVTGEALAANVSYPSNLQAFEATPVANFSNPEPAQPTSSYLYNEQPNTSTGYTQQYQNHPGYTFNPALGNYEYSYGSQNSYSNYSTMDQGASAQSFDSAQPSNKEWSQQVYTSAGTCDTVQSPSECPVQPLSQTSTQSNDQIYYNLPYGYQTMQPNEVPPSSVPAPSNYGSYMNQSTYIQSNQDQNTSVTFASNQVSTPIENVQQPNFDQTDTTNVQNVPVSENTAEVPQETVENPPEVKPVTTEVAESKPEPTVFDLLSDIDFAVEIKPLTPEIKVPQISETAIKKPVMETKPQIVKIPKEEVIERPAKMDIFSDPSLMNKFTQEVKDLQNYVESFTNKTASGLTVLDAKWKTLQDVQTKENMNRSKAVSRDYEGNMASHVVPYDDSRVTLKSDPDAYINASLYKQLAPWCIPLVISKNPPENTHSIFWRAILENKISCVVCLLTEIEMQGKPYWPTAKGQSLEMNNVRVTLEEVTCTVHWTERKISVASGNTVHSVTHYQINVFPAKIVCSPLVMLCDKILSQTYENRVSNQLQGAWVQCAAGSGRSSVVSLLLMTMCQVRAGQIELRSMLDTGCINLCRNRTNVLEDTKYLADAHITALFYVQGVLCSGTTMFNGDAVTVQTGAAVLPPPPPAQTVSANQRPPKFSRESFEEMKQSPGLKSGDMKDPLNFLDPLWSLKKK